MQRQEIEALIDRWIRAVVEGRPDDFDALYAGDASEMKARARAVISAYSDRRAQIDALLVEGDRGAWRWTISAIDVRDGRRVELRGVNFQRFGDGRVLEHWTTVQVTAL